MAYQVGVCVCVYTSGEAHAQHSRRQPPVILACKSEIGRTLGRPVQTSIPKEPFNNNTDLTTFFQALQ